jgi:lycopene beta-cyclase
MIRGIDLYEHVIAAAKNFPNIEFKIEKVIHLSSENEQAVVETENNIYTTDFVFNSILFEKISPAKNKYLLLQHFKGWMIETDNPCFNPTVATFMDFTVEQTQGTTFMYVLPVSENKALVEYTLFTENILKPEEYDTALRKYVFQTLNINEYKISHEEFGIIPMTNQKFAANKGRIINIGTAGGQTKASSGFTFQFIQKQSNRIIDSLVKNEALLSATNLRHRKFRFYDSVLLNILAKKKMSGQKIFTRIFQNCSPQTILKFLDNESDLFDDLEIIYSLPINKFLRAGLQEICK